MIINIPCYHTGCNVKGGHPITLELPNICGVLNCTREAKTSIRIGFTFYKVCMIHAQGTLIHDTKPLEVEA